LVPVLREAGTAKMLAACHGKGFVGLRDEALVRLYANTGDDRHVRSGPTPVNGHRF
jgi:hypothetical protein